MAFRIDDLSVRLMLPDKNKDEGKGRPRPKDDSSHQGDQGQGCTMATATPYTQEIQKRQCPGTKEGGVEALARLQAQLRATLAPPPL
ncbi:MAG TPA: hypothetical protein VNM67_09625 [Thermoanaerobaculia bacterium]|jgi:hypothetical protein|nr:hypothetical protein [Thermoanaerobaculia bacterium]